MHPTVSVVIPSYNHEKYIEETLDSILNQTFQDFEIIITDDGSSDQSVEKIKKYLDPRIKLYVFEKNKGACTALNNCIINSKGKYIAYVSSDDVWEPDKLEKQLKFLENSQVPVVFTKAKIIDENSNIFTEKNHPYYSIFDQDNRSREERLRNFFFSGNCLCHPSILIKKSVYDELGLYNERMANLPDFEMWIRICMKYDIHILDEKLTRFRVRSQNANASGINPRTLIRTRFEWKQVLDHYLKIDDINFFLKIFPDAKKYGKPRTVLIPYFLGRLIQETKVEFKNLWGLETIYNLMQSSKIVEMLEKDCNFRYSDFIELSAKKDVFRINLVNMLQMEYDFRYSDFSEMSTEEDISKIKKKLDNWHSLNKEENKILTDKIKKKENKYQELISQINNLTERIYEMKYLTNKDRAFTQRFISRFPSLYLLFNRKNGFKNALINIKGYKAIKKNNLFNIGYYLKNNPDVMISGIDPLIHYIYYGFKEGRNPNQTFDTNYYLKYNDVRNSDLNPLVHYSLYGMDEKRKIKRSNMKSKRQINVKNGKRDNIPIKRPTIDKYREIINRNRSMIKLRGFNDNSPLVSVIIINRNGLKHLKRLFKNFKEDIQYPNYEIIVVDNASTDDSISFLEHLSNNFPLRIIKNPENLSFSKANNEAANIAKGEFILFLNNDIEPTYGWLNVMMQTALKSESSGAIGAKLVYPDNSLSVFNKENSFKIQHIGIAFEEKPNGLIEPYNIGKGLEPFDGIVDDEQVRVGVTAAVMLVSRKKYLEVGGLDEGYNYGYEDVDFCLKLLKKGYRNIYCPKALLFHYEHGTSEKSNYDFLVERYKSNINLFISKWGDWLHEQLLKDKLNNTGIFLEKH